MKNSINILVADDDPGVIRHACKTLDHEGYSVEGVLSGETAQDRIERNDYDLAFIDLAMPGMDSIYLIKWIRLYRPGVGIVVMADHMMQETVREAYKFDIISHMKKPFTPVLLKEVTGRALELIKMNAIEREPEDKFPPEVLADLDDVIHRHRQGSNNIVRVLLDAQDILGYLPSLIQDRIARKLNMYPSEVRSIVSFYPCFRTKPGSGDASCYKGGGGRAWRGVPWKTGKKVIDAVNEYIRTKQVKG